MGIRLVQVMFIGVIGILLVSCAAQQSSFESSPRVQIEDAADIREEAIRACHHFVQGYLQWGERAEFKEFEEHKFDRKKDDVYRIESQFRSFVRSLIDVDRKYSCLVKKVGDHEWARGPVFVQPDTIRVSGGGKR